MKIELPDEYVKIDGEKIQIYKAFPGRNIDEMPKLVSESRIPIGVAEIMVRNIELEKRDNEEDVKEVYRNNGFTTGDAFISHPSQRFAIIFNSERLRKLNSHTPRKKGALTLTDECFKDALMQDNVYEIKKEDLIYNNQWLSKQEAFNSKVWRIINRHPDEVHQNYVIPELHEEVVDYSFSKAKYEFESERAMEISIRSIDTEGVRLKPLTVSSFKRGARLSLNKSVDDPAGILIGRRFEVI